ncbi:hypothetical protein SAMN05421867_11438 [Cellulomonas marina]|uniref:Uncharacterized protein n=1 Tax=Cellulomonas marina TaxID=988821 RepID=A0A1I1A1D8_9CELL|nr:hypothetical protein SAMN05421867_11438 [Cellulomonas marina]
MQGQGDGHGDERVREEQHDDVQDGERVRGR